MRKAIRKGERNHRTTEPPAAPPKPASHQLLSLSSHMTMKMRLTAPRWRQGPSFTGWRHVDRGAQAGPTPLGSGAEHAERPEPRTRALPQGNPGRNLHVLAKGVSIVSCLLFPYQTICGSNRISQNYRPSTNSQPWLNRLSKPVKGNHMNLQTRQSVRHANYFWHFVAQTLHLGYYL